MDGAFTGSLLVGAALSGRACRTKQVTLELGGNAAAVCSYNAADDVTFAARLGAADWPPVVAR